jgi:hypothetical protein
VQFYGYRAEIDRLDKNFLMSYFYSVINSLTANQRAQPERINAEPSRNMYIIVITFGSFFFDQRDSLN